MSKTVRRPRVALGMSGGVDSSLSAHLLVEQGYDVTGVYLECWRAPGCRTDEDRKDALRVALDLGIPFQVLDFKQEYKDRVVEYFFAEYEAGRTPNPDVMCNREIKFGLFYDWAMNNGFEFVATGHYAQMSTEKNQPVLFSSADTHKDQTYFLYVLTDKQLSHTLFPIGHLTKPEVRLEAAKRGLAVATKKDSVGICFIGDINVHGFLKDRLGENPGEVVDTKGQVIGTHQGLWFYTIGQRHGFTVHHKISVQQADGSVVNKHLIPPFYVIRKEPRTNQLVVGFGADAYQAEFRLTDLHFSTEIDPTQPLFIRIRHTGQLHAVTNFISLSDTSAAITLHKSVQGIAEGQAGVLYQPHQNGFTCRGGGVIQLAD